MSTTINYRLRPASPFCRHLGGACRAGAGLFVCLVGLAIVIGCVDFLDEIEGSGNVVADAREVEGDFDAVEVQGPPSVTIKVDAQAERPTVVVTTDDNLQEHITTTIEKGALVIDTEDNLSPTKGIKVEITVNRLSAVRLLGSGDITAEGVEAEAFTARLTGSGDITILGKAGSADLGVTGSGDLNAEGLEAATAKAKVTGSGDLTCKASESAEASVTGSGDIVLAGKPAQLRQSVTGSGAVRVK